MQDIASETITTSAPTTTVSSVSPGEWSDWSACPVTCGSGYYQVRTRSGDGDKDFKPCNSDNCPGIESYILMRIELPSHDVFSQWRMGIMGLMVYMWSQLSEDKI